MQPCVDLSPFVQAVRLDRNLKIGMGLALIAFGALGMNDPFGWFGPSATFFFLLGCLLFFSGVWLSYKGLQILNPADSRLFELINKRPHEVVWIYHYIVESMPFGIRTQTTCTVHINLMDGSCETIRVAPCRVNYMLEQMRSLFPNASFGHNLNKEQLYRANPMLLKQD